MKKSPNKEGLFNFYLYKNKNILEDIFNVTITNMQMETNIGSEKIRRVDIYGKTSNNELILGEVQLTTADNIHLTQVLNNILFINSEEPAIIFWIAKDFQQYYIKEIKEAIKGKNIIFYAIRLGDVDKYLNLLSTLGESEATLNINILSSIPRLLNIDSCFVSNDSSFVTNSYCIKSNTASSNLSDKVNMLNDIHLLIKNEITDNYKLNFTKNFENNFFYVPSGQSDVSFRISYNKRKNCMNVDLIFQGNKKEKFYNLLEKENKIIEDLNNEIEFCVKGTKINYYKQIDMKCLEIDLKDTAKHFCIMYRYFKLYI